MKITLAKFLEISSFDTLETFRNMITANNLNLLCKKTILNMGTKAAVMLRL
jgi:hypothetical protein